MIHRTFGQEKLREAAKAQIRRWCTPHRKKTALNAPEWVRNEWQKDQSGAAKLLVDCNFNKEPWSYDHHVIPSQSLNVNRCGLWAITMSLPIIWTTSYMYVYNCYWPSGIIETITSLVASNMLSPGWVHQQIGSHCQEKEDDKGQNWWAVGIGERDARWTEVVFVFWLNIPALHVGDFDVCFLPAWAIPQISGQAPEPAPQRGNISTPRAKISGAKKLCEAKKDTHIRQGFGCSYDNVQNYKLAFF